MKVKTSFLRIAFFASLVLGLCACGPSQESSDSTTSSISSSESEDVNVKIRVVNKVDMPLSAKVELKDFAGQVAGSATTDENGDASFTVKDANYTVSVTGLPKGYFVEDSITLSKGSTDLIVKASSSVIQGQVRQDHDYTLGDIMYDFSYVDSDGNVGTLIDTLEKKDMVFINFWYTTCSACYDEFPFLNSAYNDYSDKIEVIALDPFETISEIRAFKAEEELDFPMCQDDELLSENFGVKGYPTSIIVDRYGMITMIRAGSIPSKSDFCALFDRFIGENYVPVIAKENGDFVDDVEGEMPPSEDIEAVVNGEGFSGHFYGEEGEDAAYNWPWVISEDGTSIEPSNTRHGNSYSIIYTTITLGPDQVFAFDYLADTETNCDSLYVFVDRDIAAKITGHSEDWETCYAYIPLEEGTHEVAFAYTKDASGNAELDTVRIKNLRIIPTSRMEGPLYVFHYAAYGYDASLNAYTKYITPVYNDQDGYYHVGRADGPILLADLLYATKFSGDSIFAYLGYGVKADVLDKYSDLLPYLGLITNYASYQSNSKVGLVPVTKELHDALVDITRVISNASDNEWLEVCCFYSAYNTAEMPDPIKGVAPFSAYEGKEGVNNVTFDHFLMPRGLLVKFVPEQSGIYHFYSFTVDEELLAETTIWLKDENLRTLEEFDASERYYMTSAEVDPNFSLYYYLEAGVTYYAVVAFENLDYYGDLPFAIEYLDKQSMDLLMLASPGPFTTANDDMSGAIIPGGIKVALGEDGYYHHKREDGTLGSIIYADFLYCTGLFFKGEHPVSLIEIIQSHGFDFTVDEDGKLVEGGVDKTAEISAYSSQMIRNGSEKGLVKVDANLAELLQMLMDKYTFAGVENSWLKLCYYYKHIGK